MMYAHNYKLSKVFNEMYLWSLSLLTAWVFGRILLLPTLKILVAGAQPQRTDNLSVDEMNLTLHESRIAFVGAALVALLLLATLLFSSQLNAKTRRVAIHAQIIAVTVYVYYYWLYQSVYWWYSSPIRIDYYQASLIREFHLARAISTFFILILATSEFSCDAIKNESMVQILKKIVIQISIYLAIWALYFWSSVPNENLGLPATLLFGGSAISIVIHYFWNNFRNNAQANEIV